ncbi:MAG TPA: YIP1 family protein [Thermoanaerobaculia bacterium]|nr:YIP1 family protein [Thermoanaerobaculia bacterium]
MENSSFGRILGVLVAPVKTFRSIAERPTWVVPLVVFVLAIALMTFMMFQKVDFAEAMREQMAAQGQEVPPEAENMGGVMKGCAAVSAIVFPVILVLVLAGIYMIFNLFGGQLRYKTSLSVVSYATMPAVLMALLSIPVILSRPELEMAQLQSGRVLASNLAFLAPEDASPRLVALLGSLDFFSLWSLVLTIVGFHLAARVSKTTAAGVSIAVWVLGVLFAVAMAGFRPQGG